MPTSGEQYEKAKLYIKNKKKLKYEETAAILIAVKQKAEPVTIAEILRRKKAEELLAKQGQNKVPRRCGAHISIGAKAIPSSNIPGNLD